MKALWHNIFFLLSFFGVLSYFGCTQKKTLSQVQLESIESEAEPKARDLKIVEKGMAPAESLVFGPKVPSNQKVLRDETVKFGLENIQATHFYAVHLNNDNYVDLVILPEFYSAPVFFLYDPKLKKFVKFEEEPFENVIKASFLEFSDYNNDGVIDVLVITLNQRSALKAEAPKLFIGKYKKAKNGKKNLTFIPHPFQFPVDAYSAVTVFDYNQDGLLDLYFGNWFDVRDAPPSIRPNRFFKGIVSKEAGFFGFQFDEISDYFKDEWEQSGSPAVFLNARPTFGTGLCDFNFDGRPEILNANTTGYPNRVWNLSKIEGREMYTDVALKTQLSGDRIGSHLPQGGGHTFYLNCHDYNQDGFFDVSVGELFHSYDLDIKDRSSILTGNGMEIPYQFFRTEYHQDDGTQSWDQGDRRSIWVDLNADSFSDLVIDNSGFPPKSRLVIFKQNDDRSFEDVSKSWGLDHVNPAGSIILDVDQDGYPELLTGQTNIRDSRIKSRIFFYKNYAKALGQTLTISFDDRSRGKAIQVTQSNGLKQKLILESTNGPQSSQSENKVFLFSPKGVSFSQIEIPIFASPSHKMNLSKMADKKSVQLTICAGKVSTKTCQK